MSLKHAKRYPARLKFQVVMEVVKAEKTVGQITRSYGLHPITILRWKKEFEEKGPEIFSQATTIHEYETRIQELE